MSNWNFPMSDRKRRWLQRSLRIVSKIFGVAVIASSDPRHIDLMVKELYEKSPQTKFSWEK
jgi:hypothetical protein